MAETALKKKSVLLNLLRKGSFRVVNNFIEPRDRICVEDVSLGERLARSPDLDGWNLVLPVKKLLSTAFEDQHLIVTRDAMALRLPDGDTFDDIIPLHEIEASVEECRRCGSRRRILERAQCMVSWAIKRRWIQSGSHIPSSCSLL